MKKALYLLLFCSYLAGCDNESDDPIYPTEPFIEFKNVEFFNDSKSDPDSISLTFSYRDGDQDLGLSYIEIDSPYHEFDFFLEDGKSLMKTEAKEFEREAYDYFNSNLFSSVIYLDLNSNQTGELVTIRTRKKESFNFLPVDLSCVNYSFPSTALLVSEEDEKFLGDAHVYGTFISGNEKIFVLTDTFYHQMNAFHYNITVDFLVEQPDGSYQEFDFYENFCITFDGRFPEVPFIEYGPFKAKSISRWEGEITYTMRSLGFAYLFGGKKIKLKVTINDRALNVSNTIETPPFQIFE